ncbi:MAG: chemotaxis protein CheC [Halorientalis sp.]
MQLSVDTLGTFYQMARQGAGVAADRLTQMTGVESRVTATRIEFATPEQIEAEFAASENNAGTMVDLGGGIEGRTFLLFDRDEAIDLARAMVEELGDVDTEMSTEDLVASAITEVGGIMNNGFIDGWANVLGRNVDVSTPQFVSSDDIEELVRPADGGQLALSFHSRIRTRGRQIGFRHYFIPAADSALDLFSAEEGIEYENLAGFDRVAQRGTDRVTEDLSRLTGIDTTVDVRRVSFISLDAIPEAVPNDVHASVAFSFSGAPSGYLLFLFDRDSAHELVRTMTGAEPEENLSELGRDALQEAANIMASGMLDGWANVLDSSIDHSTPTFAWEMGPAAVDPLIVGLSRDQEFAFVFDTEIEAENDAFDAEVYIIPDEDDLKTALQAIDIQRVETAEPAADVDVGELSAEDLEDVEEVSPE